MIWKVAALILAFDVGVAHAGDAEKGKAIYGPRCSHCHGAGGKGDGPAGVGLVPRPANFAAVDYWKTTDRERLKSVIKNGKAGTGMVPFRYALGETDVDDVLSYLETFGRP